MERLSEYIAGTRSGLLDSALVEFYGEDGLTQQRQRYQMLLGRMEKWAGDGDVVLVSAPGRTELGGNHTDHNHGVVLAAAVSFDCLAVAFPSDSNCIRVRSEGFAETIEVDLSDLSSQESETGTPAALIRGVADAFSCAGFAIGSFDACIAGSVPVGAGLSSSAAFEVCIGQIFNQLFNEGAVPPIELARFGRWAENRYFGKPCGFMDQIACAVQGVQSIDFLDQENPIVSEVDFDFSGTGYQLVVVDTGGSHADLTPEYAAIPDEMTRAARVLGQDFARGLTVEQVLESALKIRRQAGDRALLRLIHFIEENQRAIAEAEALRHNDMATFLELVSQSGDSSWRLLQNCTSTMKPEEQGVTLALTLTERFLEGEGAWRIQGGGFAGTIQAYVPEERFAPYTKYMESVFGRGAVVPLRIRTSGHDRILLNSMVGDA